MIRSATPLRCQLAHSMPGRVRVRFEDDDALHDIAAAFEEFAARQPGIHSVSFQAASRSVVVSYDPDAWSEPEIVALVTGSEAGCGENGRGPGGEEIPFSFSVLSDQFARWFDWVSERTSEWAAELVEPAFLGDADTTRDTRAGQIPCQVVHAVPGRVRLRVGHADVFDNLRPEFERFLREQPGIEDVRTNPACRSVVVICDPAAWNADRLQELVAGVSLDELARKRQFRVGEAVERESRLESSLSLALSTASVLAGFVGASTLAPLLLAAASVPMFRRAAEVVFRQGRLNVDTLDAAATTVMALRGQFRAASMMVWLVSLGDVIRDVTMRHSERAITDLFDTQAQTAWLVEGDGKRSVRVSDIREGDELVVYAGELIPVDGTVARGKANVDQAFLTGESMPADKGPGERVFAGTVVRDGKLYVRAEQVGTETMASKIVRLVRDAPVRESRMQNYAERFADRMVPWSFLGAGASFAASGNANLAASILIADYGTGIRVSAPTAVLSSMARAARQGILIKGGGRYLELLAETDVLVFDKTGTLTRGAPRVCEVAAYSGTDRGRVLALAAAAEQRLTHPVAEAIELAAEERGIAVPERETSEYRIGLGVEARIEGLTVLVGCQRFMAAHHVSLEPARDELPEFRERAWMPVFVAVEGELAGVVALSDPMRREAAEVIRALHERGVREVVMLTGDSRPVARRVADALGIDRFVAEAMPEDKARFVTDLQRSGRTVAVVGDGVNDSPALAQADVGIAVHGGSDVAGETADVMLLDESLWRIPQAIDIARDAMSLIDQGWKLNLYPNTAALGLSVVGVIGPVGATLISNGSAVLGALNALRPLLGRPSR